MSRSRYEMHVDEEQLDGARRPESVAVTQDFVYPSASSRLGSLATAPARVRGQELARLQAGRGNAAVARALAAREAERSPTASPMSLHSEAVSHTFTASIRCAEPGTFGAPTPQPVTAGAFRDAIKGAEHGVTPQQAAAAVGVPAEAAAPAAGAAPAAAPAPAAKAEGEPAAAGAPAGAAGGSAAPAAAPAEAAVSLPDIVLTGAEQISLCDALWPWLGYSGAVSRGGAAPGADEFGVTRPGDMTLTGITVRHILGQYLVSATLNQKLVWQVRTGAGPTGEQAIESSLDPHITKANHAAVADDLTPDMSDLGGRPPRTHFWARDLTEQHEKFHADDAKGRAPGAISLASTWLGTQQAADVPGVKTLLDEVPGRAFTAFMASMAFPAREERAYGDGAGAYSRRAMAIRALGTVGWYS